MQPRVVASAGAPVPPRRPSRRTALLALAVLTLFGFGLRVWRFDHGLPQVRYSDHVQVAQAEELLENGLFKERSSYPVTHVYVYAAVIAAAYPVERLLGLPRAASWEAYRASFKSEGSAHGVARLYTAVMGALLGISVYRLARIRFGRGAALLAAAAVAFSPAHVIYAHQARIHVPGITLLVFAIAPGLRLVARRATATRALLAGVGCAFVASVFQLGFLQLAALSLLIAVRVRPMGLAMRRFALLIAAFGAVAVILYGIGHPPGVVVPLEGTSGLASANVATLGIPDTFIRFRPVEQLPQLLARWAVAEPAIALGCLLFVGLAAVRRVRWSDLLLFGAYPAILFLVLGTNYREVRYSLSATPFLAILAAAAALHAGRPAALGLGALLVAVPLVHSIRYDVLLTRSDTRTIAVRSLLHELEARTPKVVVDERLVSDTVFLKGRIQVFPPRGAKPVIFRTHGEVVRALQSMDASVFLAPRSQGGEFELMPAEMRQLGFVRAATIPGSPVGDGVLPDAPSWLTPQLWEAQRPGPTLDLWLNWNKHPSGLPLPDWAEGIVLTRR